MSINKKLLKAISSDSYDDYLFDPYDMKRFLTKKLNFPDRQRLAIDLIEGIMINHGKKRLLKYVVELAKVEHGIKELQPWLRDHVVHALLCYVLGAYLNENFLKPSNGFLVNEFQWKVACLFHDVGYPAQAAKDILKQFTETMNDIAKDIGVPTDEVYYKIVPINFENLTNGLNSFDLIQKEIDGWGLNINAHQEYDDLFNSGGVCHGMISALVVLRVIDLLYQKFNKKRKYIPKPIGGIDWNQKWFVSDVVPSCAAIFLHNLPSRCFKSSKIDRKKAPLAFLLKLSDCLQEWERPSKRNQTGYPSDNFDIELKNGRLSIVAEIDEDRKDEINTEIKETLIAPDVEFV